MNKKKPLLSVIVLVLYGSLYGQQKNHVVLISIDGLRPEFYLDESWPAPTLRKLKAEGVYATEVRSVFPSVTYPAHTTLITGAYPARHGVFYNAPYGAKKGVWYWEESAINVPTLWDAVKNAGLTSGAVMWPVTVGAPITYNFPVRRADDDEKTNQIDVTRPLVTPAGLLERIEKEETGPLTMDHFNTNNTIDITIGKISSFIIKKYKPNLLALHFVTVDHLAHEYGREGEKVKSAVALVDSMIGVVLKTIKDAGLKEKTTIIITGDHGFVNTTQTFSPNVLLAQHGLLDTGEKGAIFHSAGGASFLYVNNNDAGTVNKIKELLLHLPESQKNAFRIVERVELDKAGANPEVTMALAMANRYTANNDSKGAILKPKKFGGTHGYFPDFKEISTGFIAVGNGIGPRGEIKEMGIKDVAPLIARLLNLSFTALDGVLIPGILKK